MMLKALSPCPHLVDAQITSVFHHTKPEGSFFEKELQHIAYSGLVLAHLFLNLSKCWYYKGVNEFYN